jgi:transcriptional regulator with XRE-family HTH domain
MIAPGRFLGGGVHGNQLKLFGRRVRAIRKTAQITQEDASERAHLNSKYLGEIERGEKRPSFGAILALNNALNVSPAVFFHFDREERNEKVLRKKIEALLQKSEPDSYRKSIGSSKLC